MTAPRRLRWAALAGSALAPLGRRLLRGAVRTGFALAPVVGLWLAGLVWFAADMPSAVADSDTPTDAIVVLTGGSVRIKTGIELLRSGRGQTLFVSGVHQGVDLADLARSIDESPDGLSGRIVLGYAADDTIGNAAETAGWMRHRRYGSLRLVTAAYHMKRSLLEFQRAMPGVAIISHPVYPPAVKQDQWWLWPGTATLIATEYTKYLLALLRHTLAQPA